MAKKDYISQLEEDMSRARFRMILSGGILAAFMVLYGICYAMGFITMDNISIASGACLVFAVVCCSVLGANFNTWNRSKKAIEQHNARIQMKKKRR